MRVLRNVVPEHVDVQPPGGEQNHERRVCGECRLLLRPDPETPRCRRSLRRRRPYRRHLLRRRQIAPLRVRSEEISIREAESRSDRRERLEGEARVRSSDEREGIRESHQFRAR